MPIRPENMSKYPGGSIRSPEWLTIRERIRVRANDCCEQCGVVNLTYGYRVVDGSFVDLGPHRGPAELEYLSAIYGTTSAQVGHLIRIVCTVAHVDCKPVDHSDENLRFWCQRCHNRHDAKTRRENATITRHEKAGQLDLIGRPT